MGDDPLGPVYDWLVTELHFPWDMTTATRPAWLDVRRLAERWREHEGPAGESADDYVLAILAETGWEMPEDSIAEGRELVTVAAQDVRAVLEAAEPWIGGDAEKPFRRLQSAAVDQRIPDGEWAFVAPGPDSQEG
jgi:hypothetical protein